MEPGALRAARRGVGVAALVLCTGFIAIFLGSWATADSGRTPAASAAGLGRPLLATATVSAKRGLPVPSSYLGISTEYWTLPLWERQLPVVERVLDQLRLPGEAFMLRIGGDSADHAFWDGRGQAPDWSFELTPAWLAEVGRLIRATDLRVILDLNLVTATPPLAVEWAAAALAGLPRGHVAGFEIGNEPDLYLRTDWLTMLRSVADARALLPVQITPRGYAKDFAAYAALLHSAAPGMPLLGPAVANPVSHRAFLQALLSSPHPGLREITIHRYPYSACAFPGTPAFPTVARVLSPAASTGVAQALRPIVTAARRAGLPVRLSELNSVTCGGRPGVSDTFATALWAPDALFELMRAGVAAADVHVRQRTVNAAFTLTPDGLLAHPLLYGLILFQQALGGPGARLLPVHLAATARTARLVKVWAVQAGPHTLHVLVIDKSARAARVILRLPARGPAVVRRLLAASVHSRHGVTFGGRWLDASGTWTGRAVSERLVPQAGRYVVRVPGAGAALLAVTLRGSAHSQR